MIDYNEKQTLFKIQNTVIEMLEDRNYNIDNKYKITFNEFNYYLDKNNIDIFATGNENNIYVYFYNDNKNFGKNEFKNTVSKIREEIDNNVNIIIIIKEKENSSVKKEIILPIYKNVEIFTYKQLTFNITKHDIVPKHILLKNNNIDKNEEIENIINMYSTPLSKFPKISIDDPISKYFGAKQGDLFKIYRKSYSVGESIAYRLVK